MFVRHCSTLVEVQAPAKINLFLEVLSRRDDGFHEIETLMVPIDLSDTMTLAATHGRQIHLTCRWLRGVEAGLVAGGGSVHGQWPPLPQGEENLVVRALERLRELAGIDMGASVYLFKRIPAAAGLGGASSDAAAALVAANYAWRLGWTHERLAGLAAELGSDIPFFLHSTACVCRGRGEQIEPVAGLQKLNLVVVRPPEGLSTPAVYGRCRPADAPRRVSSILAALRGGNDHRVGQLLFNRLQDAARCVSPWIERLQTRFEQMGCLGHQMSGSGTSYFGVCRHARHARSVAGRLRAAGFAAVYPVTTQTVALRHG
jgi:4-diphosphocytidyl-2-C-methyl-D-erythritol kinase